MKNLIKSLVLTTGLFSTQSFVFADDVKVNEPSVAPTGAPVNPVAPKVDEKGGKKPHHSKAKKMRGKDSLKVKDAKIDAGSEKMPHTQEKADQQPAQ